MMAAIDMWDGFEEELLQRLIESMDRRMQAMIDAGDWYTIHHSMAQSQGKFFSTYYNV